MKHILITLLVWLAIRTDRFDYHCCFRASDNFKAEKGDFVHYTYSNKNKPNARLATGGDWIDEKNLYIVDSVDTNPNLSGPVYYLSSFACKYSR